MRALAFPVMGALVLLASSGAGAEDIEVRVPLSDVPTSPAQAVLARDIQQVLTPAAPAELGASATTLVSPDGTVNSGVGVELSLRRLGVGKTSDYFDSRGLQFASRLSFSVSSAALDVGADGATDMGLAFGFRSVLWLEDEADPVLSPAYRECAREARGTIVVTACLAAERARCDALPTPAEEAACQEELATRCKGVLQEQFQRCVSEGTPKWNPGSAIIGVAPLLRLPGGTWGGTELSKVAVWFTAAFPLADWGQLALAANYQYAKEGDANDVFGGLKLRAGGDEIRAVIDVGYLGTDVSSNDKQHLLPTTLGAEFQVVQGLWLTAGFGTTFDTESHDQSRYFVLSNFTWGMSPTAVYPLGPADYGRN